MKLGWTAAGSHQNKSEKLNGDGQIGADCVSYGDRLLRKLLEYYIEEVY